MPGSNTENLPIFSENDGSGSPSTKQPEGSGGKTDKVTITKGPTPPPANGSRRTFTGRLGVRDGGGVYLSAGGLEAEVFDGPGPDETGITRAREAARARFTDQDGPSVMIWGCQQGSRIVQARPLPSRRPAALQRIEAVIREHGAALRAKYPEIVSLAPGYRFKEGWITEIPALVVTLLRKRRPAPAARDITRDELLKDVNVDIAAATPEEQLRYFAERGSREAAGYLRQLSADEAGAPVPGGAEEGARLDYVPPRVSLDPVEEPMVVTCHTSPDAGWPLLRDFLGRVEQTLTLGMYDFTAPHILRHLKAVMRQAEGDLTLVLDGNKDGAVGKGGEGTKADDVAEEEVVRQLHRALRDCFKFAWAAVALRGQVTGGYFKDAYHIKVAVVDGSAFWLSSGNWQSSNQPDVEPLGIDAGRRGILGRFNREWHIIVENPRLAGIFEAYLKWDLEQALKVQRTEEAAELGGLPDVLVPEAALEVAEQRYFTPLRQSFSGRKKLRVQPVLTPDNYIDIVLPLIQGARRSLRLQNQYINIPKSGTPEGRFRELIEALRDKMNELEDVRVMLRAEAMKRDNLERLAELGLDTDRIRLLRGNHTKGIIVDGQRILIGSHNWSGPGTQQNRDASLLIDNQEIAGFYAKVFDYDWDRARQSLPTEEFIEGQSAMPQVLLTGPEAPIESAPTIEGGIRLAWRDWTGEA